MFKEAKKTFLLAKELKNLRKGDQIQKTKAAKALANFFQFERGPFFKLGQYLGTDPNAIKDIQDLAQREDSLVDLESIKSFLASVYHCSIDNIFSDISQLAKLASIGQVHQATLKTGERVALKIRLPQVEEEIKEQLKILGLGKLGNLTSISRKWGVDFAEYTRSFREGLLKELNYRLEMKNHLTFKLLENYHSDVRVPSLFEELCTDYTLLEEWMDGVPLNQVCSSWTQEEKRNLSKILLASYLTSIFKVGIIQCDFNHGNFLFQRENLKMIYLDFGNCLFLDLEKRLALLKLIVAVVENQEIDPLPYLVSLGFDKEKLFPIHASLPFLLKEIFDPFNSPYAYNLNKWKLSENVDKILGNNKWWFRSAGSSEFFKLIQSYIGMINMLRKLDSPIKWIDILNEYLKEEINNLKDFTKDFEFPEKYNFSSMATHISIKITEDDEEKLVLTLPIKALVDLELHMGEQTASKLKNKGIDISALIQKSVLEGCLPGELFHFSDDKKKILINLEKNIF